VILGPLKNVFAEPRTGTCPVITLEENEACVCKEFVLLVSIEILCKAIQFCRDLQGARLRKKNSRIGAPFKSLCCNSDAFPVSPRPRPSCLLHCGITQTLDPLAFSKPFTSLAPHHSRIIHQHCFSTPHPRAMRPYSLTRLQMPTLYLSSQHHRESDSIRSITPAAAGGHSHN
jgi:hypothetical protein